MMCRKCKSKMVAVSVVAALSVPCPEFDFSSGGQESCWGKGNSLWRSRERQVRSKKSRKSDVFESRQAVPEPDFHGVDLGK